VPIRPADRSVAAQLPQFRNAERLPDLVDEGRSGRDQRAPRRGEFVKGRDGLRGDNFAADREAAATPPRDAYFADGALSIVPSASSRRRPTLMR